MVKGLQTTPYKIKVLRVYELKKSRAEWHVTLYSNILGALGSPGNEQEKTSDGSARAKMGMLET